MTENRMTEQEKANYRSYIYVMKDVELDNETLNVVRQANSIHDDMRQQSCDLITMCVKEWENRGQASRFLKAYNTAIDPIEIEFM
jgi:hypothetical protein